jgi:hypothetical protein
VLRDEAVIAAGGPEGGPAGHPRSPHFPPIETERDSPDELDSLVNGIPVEDEGHDR